MSTARIPRHLEARSANESLPAQKIPRIIYQTFETEDLAEGMYRSARSWIDMNPEFEYRFSSNEDRRAMLKENFGDDSVRAYDRLQHGAFRADYWRYHQLYLTGGIYADVDSVCIKPLSKTVQPGDTFIAAIGKNVPHCIANGFICAAPKHPFLKSAIKSSTQKINEALKPIDGFKTTGPWGLGMSINRVLGRRGKYPFQTGLNEGGKYSFRLLEYVLAKGDLPGRLLHNGEIAVLTDYPGYHEDLADIGISHWIKDDFYVNRSFPRLRRAVQKFRKRFPGWI